jgi:hypothetical protein
MKLGRYQLLTVTLLALAPCARADDAITITDDVLMNSRLAHDPHGRQGMCGYTVQGNHSSHADPKVVWDINIDEIFTGDRRIVGVSAGSFDVAGGQRKPRAPITELAFRYEGGSEPVPVELVGSPNASNAVQGTVELERATPLFEAFTFEKWITIDLKYSDGRAETLRTRGFRDSERGKKMSMFARCLRGDTPPVGRMLGNHLVPR